MRDILRLACVVDVSWLDIHQAAGKGGKPRASCPTQFRHKAMRIGFIWLRTGNGSWLKTIKIFRVPQMAGNLLVDYATVSL
jgi:hypothetical protein